MNRRSFLKRASGIVAAVAVPLFIPAERLEFGVPKLITSPPPLDIVGGELLIDNYLVAAGDRPGLTMSDAALYGGFTDFDQGLYKRFTEMSSVFKQLAWQPSDDGQNWTVLADTGADRVTIKTTQRYVRMVTLGA